MTDGGLRYVCDVCKLRFVTNYNLKRHARCHEKTRPRWQCSYCDKSFTRRDSLPKHINLCHKDQVHNSSSNDQSSDWIGKLTCSTHRCSLCSRMPIHLNQDPRTKTNHALFFQSGICQTHYQLVRSLHAQSIRLTNNNYLLLFQKFLINFPSSFYSNGYQ